MCGIAGVWAPGIASDGPLQDGMLAALHHRGPDSFGKWQDADRGITLLHTRLAIVDLSPQGHQPMVSPSGNLVVTFNGEIYNHQDIRQRLQGRFAWKGHSDTETLLAAIECWGLQRALDELVGMFAFAVWDRQKGALTVARDRLGEKPLYWAQSSQGFYFASELKALKKCPGVDFELDTQAVSEFFRYGYVGGTRSIHRGIRKLAPGTFMVINTWSAEPAVTRYWQPPIPASKVGRFGGNYSDDDCIVETEACLRQAIAGQMLADVPLGAFLSGGIDSSLIVALMTQMATQKVKTFSMGVQDSGDDESQYARVIANHLGTEHTELMVTANDIIDLVPSVSQTYDEPFADSSQVPSMLLSKLTRQHVTVALTGDGGDELFGGYNRHLVADRMEHALGRVPAPMRRGMAGILKAPSAAFYDGVGGWARTHGAKFVPPNLSEKIFRMAAFVAANDEGECYESAIRQSITDVAVTNIAQKHAFQLQLPPVGGPLASRLMWWDMQFYMPDDILVKVDRASMAYSLETRAPFLDHRVVEVAQALPLSCKIKGRQTKWVLREILSRYVPRAFFERPKQGFTLPIDSWLRGPLRDWAEGYLSKAAVEQSGYLDFNRVSAMWQEHLSGNRNHQRAIWTVLMFQAWLEARSKG